MPQVAVAAAAAWAASTAAEFAITTWGLSTIAAGAVGAVTGAAVTAGGNALLSRGQGSVPSQERMSVVRQAAAARRLVYGDVVIGGVLAAPPLSGLGSNKFANLIIILGEGPFEAIDPVFYVGERMSDAPVFDGLIEMHANLGTDDQPALASMIAERPDVWTADHRLAGIAHVHVRIKFDANAFPGGLPQLRFRVRGRKVFDHRTGLTAWTRNRSLCILDYLRHDAGLRCPDDLIDFDSFAACAGCDDEIIVSRAASNTVDGVPYRVRRHTLDGMVDLGAGRAAILGSLEAAGAGRLVFSAGQYRMAGAAFDVPHELPITEPMLRDAPAYRPRPTRSALSNIVAGTYSEPAQDWQDTDYAAQADAVAIASDGDEIVQTLALPYTTVGATAQRLARLALRRTRNAAVLTLPCNWSAMVYRLMDVVTIDLPDVVPPGTWRITGYAYAEGGGIDLQLVSESAADYAWNADTDETLVAPVVRPANGSLAKPLAPLALAVSGAPRVEEYGTVPVLSATWTAPDQAAFLYHEVQYKRTSDASYAEGQTTTAQQIAITGVDVDTEYDLRVRTVLTSGRYSDWVEQLATLVQNDTSSPGLPTLLSVTGSGVLTIGWTTPADDDFRTSRVYANTVASPTGATLIASIVGLPSTAYTTTHTPGGLRYYYVSSVDRTGNESALELAGSGS